MNVEISSALLENIRRLAAASADEVCGLLLGEPGHIRAILPARNVHPDPRHFFELDPAVLFGALRRAWGGGPGVIGHYHSHPNGRAEPSLADAAAADPSTGYLWLIVAGNETSLFRASAQGRLHGVFDRFHLVTKETARR